MGCHIVYLFDGIVNIANYHQRSLCTCASMKVCIYKCIENLIFAN